MPLFHTSSGDVSVENWGYMLQGLNGAPLDPGLLAQSAFDLMVMDFSRDGSSANRFTQAEVAAIQNGPGGRSVAVSYISIGEASDFRDHWHNGWTSGGNAASALTVLAPDWLGPNNADWPESRKVRYWDAGWQDVIFNEAGTGWLDEIVAQGFDAAYLDIVDAYYFWGVTATAAERQPGDPATAQEAAARMVDFIVDMTAHARISNPDFFVIPQNGAFLLDDLGNDTVRRAAFVDAVGAIGVEDVYFPGDLAENNPLSIDAETVTILQQDFLGNGIPVLSVDYIDTVDNINLFTQHAVNDGFIPFIAASRSLDRLDLSLQGPDTGGVIRAGAGADTLSGGAGSDTLIGGAGHDVLIGGTGSHNLRDVIYGGGGNDSIDGGYGNDLLYGDAGNDNMAGGFGADTVIGGTGNDVITGSAYGDVVFGGDGDDFLNGGFGHDRVNGGAGADKFYHLGILDHGSDWIQDYTAADGDVLVFGNAAATAADFQINLAHTADGAGVRSGDANVQEAFVIYRPTGQIMWALVDGDAQTQINIQIGGVVTDLLA